MATVWSILSHSLLVHEVLGRIIRSLIFYPIRRPNVLHSNRLQINVERILKNVQAAFLKFKVIVFFQL